MSNCQTINGLMENIIYNNVKKILENCKNGVIVYDGIIDEKSFSMQDKKVLFLLRDSNEYNPYIDKYGKTCGRVNEDLYNTAIATNENETNITRLGYMWRIVCMYLQIIHDSGFNLEDCWNEAEGYRIDEMRRCLLNTAVVNIKKTAGKGVNDDSYYQQLKCAVDNYYESVIKDQISNIKPNIVVCGGTFDFIKTEYDVKIHTLSNNKHYFIYDGCIYIESSHPAARYGYAKHYKLFKETYDEICSKSANIF